MSNIKLLYIDLFCGAGGTSTGVMKARLHGERCAEVVSCVNHDVNAIASHQANHPDVQHFTEDIRTLDLSPMVKHLNDMKLKYPDAFVVLWASLECTNFSKAKGGQPRDADSRTLAEHLFRYIEVLNPDYIQIENVEEFMCWGDIDERGKPVSKDKGRCYLRWVRKVMEFGYNYDFRILNAADFGAYTSRKRYFGQFSKCGLPIVFPAQTYAKYGDEGGLFHQYKRWKPVSEVLDLNDEGTSIFAKRKPLCEHTLERIYAGLVKFVAKGKKHHESWILKYNSMNQHNHHNAPSIDEPCPVVAVQNRLGLVKLHFLSKQFSGDPMSKNIGVDGPAGTLTTIDHHTLVSAEFLQAYYGKGFEAEIDKPCPTIHTKDRFGKVKPCFLAEQATQKWHYLMNPQFKSKGGSIEAPCFTLIARMDKVPPYLISTENGLGIEVYETDTPMNKKIKDFMVMYGIADIKMRMLNISELKRIMGFPDDYVLIGTQAEQKKFIGNAVEVNMSRVLCEALASKLSDLKK